MAGSEQVNRNIMNWHKRKVASLVALSEAYSAQMERYAKTGAIWTDRTGLARKGMFGYTLLLDDTILTRIAHTMDYGVHLELGHQGRFSILMPTVRKFQSRFLEDARRVMTGR